MAVFWDSLGIAGAVVFVFFALGFCIFSHELGHFLAGRLMGLHIDAFSLGFRPFWRRKYKGVEYRLGWLPFGGYVELPQIDASDGVPKSADGKELPRATPLARMVTAAAGPLFNILSGLLIGCIVWAVGIPQATPKMREIAVLEVPEHSPEYQAGLRKGDVIVKLNGEEFFCGWQQFVQKILYTIDRVTLEVRRGGETHRIVYQPEENPDAPGQVGFEKLAYPFFEPFIPLKVRPAPGSAASRAGFRAGDMVSRIDGRSVTGPEDFASLLGFREGKEVTVELRRGEENVVVRCVPTVIPGMEGEERFLVGVVFAGADSLRVRHVMKGGSAEEAGLASGDEIVAADGGAMGSGEEFRKLVAAAKGAPVTVTVKRDGREMEFKLTPRRSAACEIAGLMLMPYYDHPTPWAQFVSVLEMSWQSLRGIATTVGHQLDLTRSRSSLKPSHMSGPLGIGMVLFNSIRTSVASGIQFMVIISFALAIFNLLPLPVLDGGHILFGLVELVCRRPVPAPVLKALSYVFIALLVSLMLFVTFSDVRRAAWQVSNSMRK